MTKTPTMRLDRLLANMGYASRREIQLLAKNGRIRLDGAAFHDADKRIALTPDLETRLMVDGEALDPLPGFALMLHKPLGVTCSCLLYTSPSPRDLSTSRMPSSA